MESDVFGKQGNPREDVVENKSEFTGGPCRVFDSRLEKGALTGLKQVVSLVAFPSSQKCVYQTWLKSNGKSYGLQHILCSSILLLHWIHIQ